MAGWLHVLFESAHCVVLPRCGLFLSQFCHWSDIGPAGCVQCGPDSLGDSVGARLLSSRLLCVLTRGLVLRWRPVLHL